MTKPISTEDLLAMYSDTPNCAELARKLQSNGYDISERTIQRRIRAGRGNSQGNPKKSVRTASDAAPELPISGGTLLAPHKLRRELSGSRFVFTSAQNNTAAHYGFLQSLKRFCEDREAELVVSRFTYNKNGFQNGTKDDGSEEVWYDPQLVPFFMDESAQVADDLVFCGELDILPTACNPLSGFENYCGNNSAIIPHVKIAMKSMPRMKGEDPRFLYTTGTVTQRNYIQKKAGQKAEFHHVFGALYVEIDDEGDWFCRQLIADSDGFFQDLTDVYTPSGIIRDIPVEAINWGDIHVEKVDMNVLHASFEGPESMIEVLDPVYQFIHDLTDFNARNHHNIRDPYFLAEKFHSGEDSVRNAIVQSAGFLDVISARGTQTIVVESNHDLAFRRWLKEADVRGDPVNAEYWHENNTAIYKSIRTKDSRFSVFENAIRKVVDLPAVTFLREDDSFVICNDRDEEDVSGRVVGGVECGMHGHLGPNGSRGSGDNLRHIGRKANIGHVHSAGIIDGIYMSGVTCDLDMGYNKGPFSWSHSHIVTYPNGKRTIITIKRGKWRA